jgi:hypothetical protein
MQTAGRWLEFIERVESFMPDTPRPNDPPVVVGPGRPSAPRDPVPAAPPQFVVDVRFRNPLKTHRVSLLRVRLREFPRHRPFADVADTPVLVRPFIPGAQVTPVETRIDANKPGAEATFYVTALARGSYRHAHVQVLQAGRLLQEIPLSVKGTTQRLTWALALLTVLVPVFMLYACRYHQLQGPMPIPQVTPPNPEQFQARPGQGQVPPPGMQPPQPGEKPSQTTTSRPGRPGELLTKRIRENVYPIPKVTEPLADNLGELYQLSCDMSEHEYLIFWVALALLGMTIVSWMAHLPLPMSRLSEPLTLAPVAGDVFTSKTLPLGGSEQPVAVEPVED